MEKPQSNRSPDVKRMVGGILLVVLLGGGVLFYPAAKKQFATPLGPGLDLPTYTPTLVQPTETSAPTVAGSLPAQTSIPATATIQPTSTPAPLCGGPSLMYVLGVGADNGEENYQYGLGDVIRIARIDFVTPKVTMLSMPRDLWVEIPGISDHYNLTHGKLNQSYLYGGSGMGYYDGPGEGPGLMARTLDLNFGIRPDHYGAVNMSAFIKIINAVGGIDVYLPRDVDGTSTDDSVEDMGYFTAGNHHFGGEEALRFARIRRNIGDFSRQDNQTLVLCALREKVLSPQILPKVPQIIDALLDSVLTDLSLEQISQLACLLPEIKQENIIFGSLPKEMFTQGRIYSPQMRDYTAILEADYDVIRDYVKKFQDGSWPTESGESTCP